MSYGGGQPDKRPGYRATSLNGRPFAVHRAVKRIACNVSQPRVGAGKSAAMSLCNPLGVTLTLMPLDRYLWGRCFPIGDVASIGGGEQLPGGIKVIALGECAKAEDGLAPVDAPTLSGSFHALGDEGLAGGFDHA
jgi:hypothetical protein